MNRAARLRAIAAKLDARSQRRLEQACELYTKGQIEGSEFMRRRADQLEAEVERIDERCFRLRMAAAEEEARQWQVSAFFDVVSPLPFNLGAA